MKANSTIYIHNKQITKEASSGINQITYSNKLGRKMTL